MSSYELDVYMPVLILMGIAASLVVIALTVGHFIRPSNPTKLKNTAYECGELPIGSAWSNFNIRFYVVSLVFIIFDVESALMFPVAAVFKKFNDIGEGGVILSSLLVFMAVLIIGLIYCWKKGDLDWVRSFQLNDDHNLTEQEGQ